MNEKDWITKAGLRAVCVVNERRGRKTHRCGYVEVPQGHRLHGVSYSDPIADIPREAVETAKLGKKGPITAFTAGVRAFEGETVRRSPDIAFDVHGGLTYSSIGDGFPADGGGWWFGFDCAHADDGEIEPDPQFPRTWATEPARSQEYVEAECESLAAQIVAMFPLQKAAA